MTEQTDVKDRKCDFLVEITSWQKWAGLVAQLVQVLVLALVLTGSSWSLDMIKKKMRTVFGSEGNLCCWSDWENHENNGLECFWILLCLIQSLLGEAPDAHNFLQDLMVSFQASYKGSAKLIAGGFEGAI